MELKPITRQEQIIAGKQLEPITRMERFLKDYGVSKYFGEVETVVNEPLNITWDGNTEGLVSSSGGYLWKISDLVLTEEQIKSATITIVGKSGSASFSLSDVWEQMIVREDVVSSEAIAFCRKGGASDGYDTYPETGIYIMLYKGEYVSSLTTTEPVQQTNTVVHKLDKKYLPDGATPIIYVVDNSGEETVCSCSVDINTALNSFLSAPVSVKIFSEGILYEAYGIEVEVGTSGSLAVGCKYSRLGEELSEFIEHDSEGVRIGEPA